MESFGRAILSLALVIGLMWLLARWARGHNRRGRTRGSLEILARQPLTRNTSIAVVRIAERAVVLGVTENHVTLLGDLESEEFEATPALAVVTELPTVAQLEHPSKRPARQSVKQSAKQSPARPGGAGKLDGSILSRRTWTQALDVLRERTVRR